VRYYEAIGEGIKARRRKGTWQRALEKARIGHEGLGIREDEVQVDSGTFRGNTRHRITSAFFNA
jgi:hypothetical protein